MNMSRLASLHLYATIVIAGALLCTPGGVLAAAQSVDDRIQRLEQRVEQVIQRVHQPKSRNVSALEERIEKLERQQPASQGGETGNMVFFRGGGAFAASDRSGEVFSDSLTSSASGDAGYYIGAGLDLVLSKNLWGMMSNTWALGEIGVEVKKYQSKDAPRSGKTAVGITENDNVEITQLTVSVSPKILFMEGSRFRPWIIPVGLDFNVISPPSNETTVLDVGAQFAIGAQYQLWKSFHVGVDGRYHWAAGWTDTDNSFGTVGGYMGIAF